MMAQFVVTVAVLLTDILYCSAENVYCVTPTATSCSSCPQNSNQCAILYEYAQEAKLYFTSNTTMVFLPGDHVLDTNITVDDVTRLMMYGEFSSDNMTTIVRNGSVGFSFSSMVDFNIHSLVFTSYNYRLLSYGSHPASNSALLLRSTHNAELVNCSFHDNIGTALTVKNTSVTLVENKFIHNQCACGTFSEMLELGCGITTFNSNLTFIGNTSFHNITQSAFYPDAICAGAIWASASSLHFNGSNNFIGNSANGINGVGAIYAEANTSLSFSGTSIFTHNLAEVGGVIATFENVMLTFSGTNNFTSNSAKDGGGAIYASSNTSLSFSGTSQFSHNSAEYGGAIGASDHVMLTFSGTNNFTSNSAKDGGGAIYASSNTSLSFSGTSHFSHNSAKYGGAIGASDHVILTFSGTNNFTSNSAKDGGGGIYASSNTSLSFSGTSHFSHNSAEVGGAIGASDHVILTFSGTNNFTSNSAKDGGGGIYASSNTSLSFSGTSHFSHNSAEVGGAIGASDHVILTFSETNNFTSNSAKDGGGGIYASSNTSLSFSGTSHFSHNSAEVGGAIGASDHVILTFSGTNNFTSNSAKDGGGGIYASSNTSLSFSGTSHFSHNSAEVGGAIGASDHVILTFSETNNFVNNSAEYGGAIHTYKIVMLTFNGTNNFVNNMAEAGGAIYTQKSTLMSFTGTSSFCHNAAAEFGGAIHTEHNVILSFNGTNNFINNSADSGGAIDTYNNVVLNFNGTNSFIKNSAELGGAIDAFDNAELTFNGTNIFINNSAHYGGGAICTEYNGVFTFSGTSKFINNLANENSGGAIYAVTNASLSFVGISNFSHNSAGYEGGAIVTAGLGALSFNRTNIFINNSANNGGAILAADHMSLGFTGTSSFISNSAMQGGAITANSYITLTFDGNINFTNNGQNTKDSRGGAMHLAIDSTFFVLPNTIVYWENNYANIGGAIYVLTANPFMYCKMTQIVKYITKEKCFFQFPGQNLSNGVDVQFFFKNNSADTAGSVLYGGAIDRCDLDPYNSGLVFDKVVHYEADNTASIISSDPFHICLCNLNNRPNCSQSMKTVSVYPGETFQVSVVTAGQRNGIVPAAVRSHTDKGRLASSQYIQQTTKMCTTLNYTVFSQEDVSLELYPEGPCSTVSAKLLLKLSTRQSCPPGFSVDSNSMSCVCDQALQKYTNRCNITNGLGQITRESDDTFWVGYDNQSHRLILHPQCPFDNCVSYAVSFPLNNTDVQCAYNRSGLLCGACKNKYSLVLGTSYCKQCTNYHLYLLVPFALMGVALVFLLLACKLTVATGTLSGLVFYANIVGINRTIFLPEESFKLSVFIAWLNLDFGIETCFYNGMDAYSKTWLQFVFPVYIWVLVGLMILVSHFSQRFANLLGNNPVSVLATLILLSYTKVLRTLIATAYFTHLEYPTYSRSVWFYDANIDYIIGKHIPLFLVGVLVFFFLFLPYTLLLLFGQWLQAISHLRLFSWVNSARLKPFTDAYHAPYKAKHRYWPGLLLMLRFVLLLVFALNPQHDPSIDLLAILVGAGLLQLWAWICGGVYKNWCLDALEGSFTLNLTILCAATHYVNHSGGNQLAVGYTSVIIALATFTGILFYHIFQQVRHTNLWKRVPKLNLKFKKLNMKKAVNNPINHPTGSRNLDQLREPWLEDLLQPTHSSL